MKKQSIILMTVLSSLFAIESSAQEVPDYVSTNGLVGWWPFDGNVIDESGNGHHGVGTGVSPASNRFGVESGALSFSNGFVEIPTIGELGYGVNFTVSMWFSTSSSSAQALLKMGNFINANNENISIALNHPNSSGGEVEVAVKLGPNGCIPGVGWRRNILFNAELADGEYHHLVGISDDDGTLLYIDGELRSSQTFENIPRATCPPAPIQIGREWQSFPFMFQGEIDDIGIWNRPLTAGEVMSLYLGEPLMAGCTDTLACNFNPEANEEDNSCIFPLFGDDCNAGAVACATGTYWSVEHQQCMPVGCAVCRGDMNSDGYITIVDLLEMLAFFNETCALAGCTNPDALNYHPDAVVDDGSCVMPE